MSCKIVGFTDKRLWGKYPSSLASDQVIMEFGPLWQYMYNYWNDVYYHRNPEFEAWMNENGRAYNFARQLVMTLPQPRIDYYAD